MKSVLLILAAFALFGPGETHAADGSPLSPQDRLNGRRADGTVATPNGAVRQRRTLADFNTHGTNPQFVLDRVRASTQAAAARIPSQFQSESAVPEWRRQILLQLDFDSNNQSRQFDFHGNAVPPQSQGVLASYFGAYDQFTRETLTAYQEVLPAGTIATDDPVLAFEALQQRDHEITRTRDQILREIEFQQARGEKAKVRELSERLENLKLEKGKLDNVLKKFGQYFAFLEELEKTSAGSTLVFRAAHQDMMMYESSRVQGVRFTIKSLREFGNAAENSAALASRNIAEWETHLRAARMDRSIFRTLARLRNPAAAIGGALILMGGSASASEKKPENPRPGRPVIRTTPATSQQNASDGDGPSE